MIATLWILSVVCAAVGSYALGWSDRGLYESEKSLEAMLDRLILWQAQRNNARRNIP